MSVSKCPQGRCYPALHRSTRVSSSFAAGTLLLLRPRSSGAINPQPYTHTHIPRCEFVVVMEEGKVSKPLKGKMVEGRVTPQLSMPFPVSSPSQLSPSLPASCPSLFQSSTRHSYPAFQHLRGNIPLFSSTHSGLSPLHLNLLQPPLPPPPTYPTATSRPAITSPSPPPPLPLRRASLAGFLPQQYSPPPKHANGGFIDRGQGPVLFQPSNVFGLDLILVPTTQPVLQTPPHPAIAPPPPSLVISTSFMQFF